MFKRPAAPSQSIDTAPKVSFEAQTASQEAQANELDPQGFSSLKVAMGFSIMGLVGALFLTPVLDATTSNMGLLAASEDGIDTTVVGSVKKSEPSQISPDETRTYILRRSVLQKDPTVDCIIYEDGTQEGGC